MRIIHVCSCKNYGVIPLIFTHRLKNKNSDMECTIPVVEFQMSFQQNVMWTLESSEFFFLLSFSF